MTKEEKKEKGGKNQFDMTLPVKSQKAIQQFNSLTYSGSYLAFYSTFINKLL